jgi:Phage stabilisation protein
MELPGFVGPIYRARSIGVDAQECTNFFPEVATANSKAQYSLYPTPGLKLLTTPDLLGGCRGLFTTALERLLSVIGNKVVEILSDLTTVELGVITSSVGKVSMAEVITSTGSYVMIVDGFNGYVLTTETNNFAVITGDYQPGTSVISLNGYFLQNTNSSWNSGTRFIRSGQFDQANTWAASIDYYTAEVSPDPILSIQTINSEIWLLGSKSTEIWQYTGDINLLFSRVPTGIINIGVAGNYAVTTLNNKIFWVGSGPQGNGTVWVGSGYLPQSISTQSIEYIVGTMENISDCVAFSYMQEGHQFIIFNFMSGDRTLCFDTSTEMWHERGAYDKWTGKMHHHRAQHLTLWRNKIIVGDYANSNIYQWDFYTYTDNGQIIRRIRVCPHLHSDRKRIRYDVLEIDMERGVGLLPTTGPTDVQWSEPMAMLQISDDGGKIYGNEHWTTIGRQGSNLTRIKWNRLGMSRDRVFKVTFADPNKLVIIGARMDVQIAGT